jgi:hypothetical protein
MKEGQPRIILNPTEYREDKGKMKNDCSRKWTGEKLKG